MKMTRMSCLMGVCSWAQMIRRKSSTRGIRSAWLPHYFLHEIHEEVFGFHHFLHEIHEHIVYSFLMFLFSLPSHPFHLLLCLLSFILNLQLKLPPFHFSLLVFYIFFLQFSWTQHQLMQFTPFLLFLSCSMQNKYFCLQLADKAH